MFWDILPEISSTILWHENAIGSLINHFKYSRGAMIFSTHYRGIMKFLPLWNISNCPFPQYLLTTPLLNRIYFIYRTMVEVRECYGIFYLKYAHQLWLENAIGGLRIFFTYSRGAMIFSTHYRGII